LRKVDEAVSGEGQEKKREKHGRNMGGGTAEERRGFGLGRGKKKVMEALLPSSTSSKSGRRGNAEKGSSGEPAPKRKRTSLDRGMGDIIRYEGKRRKRQCA